MIISTSTDASSFGFKIPTRVSTPNDDNNNDDDDDDHDDDAKNGVDDDTPNLRKQLKKKKKPLSSVTHRQTDQGEHGQDDYHDAEDGDGEHAVAPDVNVE